MKSLRKVTRNPITVSGQEKLAMELATKKFNALYGETFKNSDFDLLGVTNAKTSKGEELGYMTAIIYLKPSKELCPASIAAGCLNACLYSAGRGKFGDVKNSRIRKTLLLEMNPPIFQEKLTRELVAFGIKAYKNSMIPLFRGNGTSDVPAAFYRVSLDAANAILESLGIPLIEDYDYTKRLNPKAWMDKHVTLSYSGANPAYAKRAIQTAFKHSKGLAVVMSKEVIKRLQEGNCFERIVHGMFNFIDGDKHDIRVLDDIKPDVLNVVVLKAKGDAIKDTSGFVVRRLGALLDSAMPAMGITDEQALDWVENAPTSVKTIAEWVKSNDK